jgi:16S rRNA (cytidine1402-2'-O)-methyltransferase
LNTETHPGTLYLCGTPIGNLEDITIRVLRILQEVDLIACEDTRQTIKLLNHFKIAKKLVSYHEHNENERAAEFINLLFQGKSIALVSDAGTPVISDPGNILVRQAIANEIPVVPLAGASAFLLTLIVSGFDISSFIYLGFLDRDKKKRRKTLEALKSETKTVVFYESPHKLTDTLNDLNNFAPARNLCIGREITKKFEQFWRGNAQEAIKYFSENRPRGEFSIVIEGAEPQEAAFDSQLFDLRLEELKKLGLSKKEISKTLAGEFNQSSKEIYNQLIHDQTENGLLPTQE